MTSRDDQRAWLATSKAWQPERDAVGLERLVDTLQLNEAAVTVGRIDLRRWARTNPELAERLREVRALLSAVNWEMMEWIQDRAHPEEKARYTP